MYVAEFPSGCFDLSRLHTSHLCRESIYTEFIFTKSEQRQFEQHTTSLLLRCNSAALRAICKSLTCSDAFRHHHLPPSWEHLIKVSKLEQQESHTRRKHCVPCKSNQLQSIDSDLVCFLQGLMRISQFGRPNSSCGLTPLTVWVLWVLPLESEENCKFLRLCTIMWYCKYGCGSLSS